MGQVSAFLAISVLVIVVVPGPDTALTIRNTLLGGRRAGVVTALGVSAGQACWTVAAAIGVAALLRASEPAFVAVRLAGALYLVFLGVQALRASFVGATRGAQRSVLPRDQAVGTALRQGLLSNLGNPKMAIFFTSLLPQFGSSVVDLLALGLALCSLTFCWLTCYAVAVAKAGDVLRRSRIRRLLDSVTGACLVGFGLILAGEPR